MFGYAANEIDGADSAPGGKSTWPSVPIVITVHAALVLLSVIVIEEVSRSAVVPTQRESATPLGQIAPLAVDPTPDKASMAAASDVAIAALSSTAVAGSVHVVPVQKSVP
jgi:hypothetical protein